MAIPSLFHIWGKPKIKVVFDCTQGYKLKCWIRNVPVNRILLSLNVIRRQVEISPMVTIVDGNGNVKHFCHYASTSSDDVHLPIAEVKFPQNGEVFLIENSGKPSCRVLGIGLYKLTLEIWGDGRRLLKGEKQFRVNQAKPFLELVC